jgi:hypothetical protein
MKIKHQTWNINSEYLILNLQEPWWSAWQRFGWVEGTEGYSISAAAFDKAVEFKKKIMIKNKYGDYEITTHKASKYLNCKFTARDGTLLICLPKDAFKKLPPLEEEKPVDMYNAFAAMPPHIRREIRIKLGLPVDSEVSE